MIGQITVQYTLLELSSSLCCGFTITLTDYSQDASLLHGDVGVAELSVLFWSKKKKKLQIQRSAL